MDVCREGKVKTKLSMLLLELGLSLAIVISFLSSALSDMFLQSWDDSHPAVGISNIIK